GGDCPGLNAAIRAVFLAANKKGWEVYGIEDSTTGFVEGRIYQLTEAHFADGVLMRLGGTFLGSTNKGVLENTLAFHMPDGTIKDRSGELKDMVQKFKLDYVIGVGGDGSFAIISNLAKLCGFKFIGIPKTIDNDVSNTEYCIGFDSAVSLATKAVDDLLPTAKSHKRVQVLEVMGRGAGNIALNTGIAAGADVILIPEIPYHIDNVINKIKSVHDSGRNYALVVVSEAIKDLSGAEVAKMQDGIPRFGGVAKHIRNEIEERTGLETRETVLGAMQRGCAPGAKDRLIACAFGAKAVDMIAKGENNKMVAWQAGEAVSIDLNDGIEEYGAVKTDGLGVRTARALDICLGDE
ncbi:MAG: ATP-dependent 6-phosphofructokinase, partial [Alphaproteobacteria bacterium]|nr:ATP-dependent 6-phosphofructokinase [Alphaproteobacteria bacterium]